MSLCVFVLGVFGDGVCGGTSCAGVVLAVRARGCCDSIRADVAVGAGSRAETSGTQYAASSEASGDRPGSWHTFAPSRVRRLLASQFKPQNAAPVTHCCACARRHVGVHAPCVCVARHGSVSSQRPIKYPELLRVLREATAAGRCKHSAPAAHYCRAKPPGGAYVQGTGSGTKRAAARRRRRLQSARRLPRAPRRLHPAAAAAARA